MGLVQLDELTKIRLATIIDCEGCIGFYDYDNTNPSKNNFGLLQIVQQAKWYCERFKNVFGFGTIHSNFNKMSPCWVYTASYYQALVVCLVLYNQLELKKEKAHKIIAHYWAKAHSENLNVQNRTLTFLKKYNLSLEDFPDCIKCS